MAKYNDTFLQDGGITGEIIRNIDWDATTAGNPSTWPTALKKAVKAMLNTTLPTYIAWGQDYIQLYNDEFIPSFGATRHPSSLGTLLKENSQMLSTVEPLFAKVMSGESICLRDMKIQLDKNGYKEECYMDIHYSPIYLDDWTVGGVQAVVIETTDKVNALSLFEQEAFKLRSLIEKAPIAICLLVGKDMKIELANAIMINFWGKTADIVGMPLSIAIPELQGQEFLQLLDNVFTTGKTFEAKAAPAQLERNNVLGVYYFDFSYIAIRNSSGKIYGVMNMATDVTQEVLALKESEENKSQLDFAIEAAQLGTWNLNPITNKFVGNNRLKAWFGLPSTSEIELQTAIDVIAEKDKEAVKFAIENALNPDSGGHYDIEYSIIHPSTKKETIVRAKGKALFNEYTMPYQFSGTLQDVTDESNTKKQLAFEVIEQRIAKNKLEESELFVNAVIYNSPVANMVFTGSEMTIKIINENMLQLIGRENSILGKTFDEVLPELSDTPLPERLKHVFLTGETFIQPEEMLNLVRFGKLYSGYYTYIYKPLRSVSGAIYGLMVTASEITEQVVARKKIEAKEKELRDLISAAPIGICILSGVKANIEEVNERFTIISGKKRAQFISSTYWEIFPEMAESFAPALENVFKTGIKFSSEETEMTLIRSGIPTRIFATFEYVPVFDIHDVVIKVIVLVIEVTHQIETRKKIEDAVEQRTKELAESNISMVRTNHELEQFAYIASHDLQEPIRKIATFAQLLETSLPDITDRSKIYFNKIYASTERMTKLIRDVLAYSQIRQSTDSFVRVELAVIIQNIQADYELLIEEKGAQIEVGEMPVIYANTSQMTQLFGNLLSNSLKYIRNGMTPLVKIMSFYASSEEIEKHPQLNSGITYYHITFTDNGIGFEQQHAEGIFNIFQRLHNKTEYEGTGIGLSICRKIVQMHNGHIFAASGINGGAIFHILLPHNR